MSDDKYEATFFPNDRTMPRRNPLETFAEHGEPLPDPRTDRMHYASPGPAPWAKSHRLPAWAWVSIILGGIFLVCGFSALTALLDESGPVRTVQSPGSVVTTTGTCEKKIVGEYGLIATVKAVNPTDRPQAGVIWVRWPITGEAAAEFTKRVTLAPGASVDFPVNQQVPAERWFRTGACTFGWTED